MDRPVKERLIGACVLVVLVVAVVPELLSGPKPAAPAGDASAGALQLPAAAPDPVRNVTVDLATAKPALEEAGSATPVASQPAAAGGAAGAPSAPPRAAGDAPGAAAPAAAAPVGSANVAAVPADAAPVRAVENAAASPTSRQGFAVQLGSFANRSNAENLVHQLKARGFPIYMDSEGSGDGTRYRVRVGPLADRDAAAHTVDNLKRLGHVATIVSLRQG
jgi:DedD protein